MSKFKVGDRVRRKRETLLSEERFGVMGVIYTISAPGLSGQWDTIEGIRVHPDYFELVEDDAETTQESGPVRTVTRKEIVLGTYDRIFIAADSPGHISLAFTSKITHEHDPSHEKSFNAAELRAAARVFNALAEALEAQE